uniref:UPAR/Ly6 domain-containing protein n=1 Tax=Oreochromis aureus TaxID=47969 RepID=A0AAZ1XUA6_OREAU
YNPVNVCLRSTNYYTNYCTVGPLFFKLFILVNVLEFVHALEAKKNSLIFIFVLSACALTCYECIPDLSGSCNETTKDCPSNTQCGSFRLTSYAGETKADVKEKGCAAAEECVQASINYGVIQTVITSKCCTSNLCNSQDAPEGSISSPNGKKCFYCDGTDCSKTLNCDGDEDYCISTTGNRTSAFSVCMFVLFCSEKRSVIPSFHFLSDYRRAKGDCKGLCLQGDLLRHTICTDPRNRWSRNQLLPG